jgi:hypothetical protein
MSTPKLGAIRIVFYVVGATRIQCNSWFLTNGINIFHVGRSIFLDTKIHGPDWYAPQQVVKRDGAVRRRGIGFAPRMVLVVA